MIPESHYKQVIEKLSQKIASLTVENASLLAQLMETTAILEGIRNEGTEKKIENTEKENEETT